MAAAMLRLHRCFGHRTALSPCCWAPALALAFRAFPARSALCGPWTAAAAFLLLLAAPSSCACAGSAHFLFGAMALACSWAQRPAVAAARVRWPASTCKLQGRVGGCRSDRRGCDRASIFDVEAARAGQQALIGQRLRLGWYRTQQAPAAGSRWSPAAATEAAARGRQPRWLRFRTLCAAARLRGDWLCARASGQRRARAGAGTGLHAARRARPADPGAHGR